MEILGSRHRLAAALLLALGMFAGSASADETCELNDGDPATHEYAGGATATGVGATACGPIATASGDSSSAFGVGSESLGFGSTAIGSSSRSYGEFSTSIGGASRAENGATALGFSSLASGDNSTAVGGWFDLDSDGLFTLDEVTNAAGGRSIALGPAAHATGIGSAALGFHSNASATLSTAVGYWSQASGFTSIAAGTNSVASVDYSTAIGGRSEATAIGSTALGNSSEATAAGSVALGYLSLADRSNTVSVGAAGSERQIVNVAAGTQANDAVNLSQLQSTLATANAYTDTAVATGGTATNAYTDNREAAIRGDMDAGDTATLTAANTYTDRRIGELAGFDPAAINSRLDSVDQQLNTHDRRINTVGALGAALSLAAPDARVQGANQFSLGVGHFRDRQALGVGYSRLVSPRAAVRISAAFADGENAAGVGLNVGW
ncbi:trimeric autotransporter adhesin [Luteimonas cucumeris]|uniref:Trimeric autotransporter adhesin n=1 Tax=Luteimonas cucumeris TaxID=985012 RepID=A0A562KUU1_9GAMM|nr:YadA-like family protein [Luteimonas cucumeris]TWH99188.1 trimeric autotransporter adhesin [Luteimonas cucumeris]